MAVAAAVAVVALVAGSILLAPKGPTIEQGRLSDLSIQTSTYGAFIPRLYGTVGGPGNLMWLENNRLKETVRKKKQGGKGGGSSTTVKTYSYSATFHLGLCEGPIAGVRRIWCADKLIYNAGSDDLETIIASNQAAAGFRIYLGTDDQMPDSRYEADVGVGNASAHRGLAYIAFYDFQLADYSNTLQAAQFKVEVVSALSLVNSITSAAMPATGNWSGLAWGDLGFCSVRGADSGAFSVDGKAWTSAALPPAVAWSLVSAGSDRYIIAAPNSNQVGYSKTGKSWGVAGLPSAQPWTLLHFTGSEFLLMAGASYTQSFYGEEWAALAATSSGSQWSAAVTVGGKTVMVSYFGPSNGVPRCARYEGGAWSENVMANVGAEWSGLDSNGSVLCTVGNDSFGGDTALGHYATSTNGGVSWAYGRMPVAAFFRDVCYGGGEFVAVGYQFSTGYIYSSPDPSTVPWALVTVVASFTPTKIVYNGAWFSITGVSQGTSRTIRLGTQTIEGIVLEFIIESEVSLSALIGPADLDASGLTSGIRGYRVSGGTIRAALEPLQGAFPFDVIQSGYKIKCVPRGQSSVATIPWEDLGATDGGEPGDILQQSREMDTQLPARTTIKYLDAAREYAVSEQYAERINTEAINRVDRDLPLVLTADEAAGVAEVLQNLPWLERTDGAFTLPPTYLHLEAADVVTVTTPQAIYELRLPEINYTPDGRLECKAKQSRAALYTPNATGGEGVVPDGTIGLPGSSLFLPLDIPVVNEALQNDPGFIGVMTGYTGSWPGGLALRTNDDGQTWTTLQAYASKATMGEAGGLLPASSGTLIDRRSLAVNLLSGELESITRSQMLTGNNYAAYGAFGRWEIVRFQTASLQADGSYLVSDFVRGDRGTEWATGLHKAGDWFVLLDDPDNAFISMALEAIGLERTYRGVTSGASVDDSSDVPFTYRGVNLECLSPVRAKAVRDGSSNLTASFTRRTRLSSSWWTNGVQAPIGEASEAYEVDVMSGATIKRTIATATPAFSYSAAEQIADFGSTQAAITFRIYQLSQYVGRGYVLEVIL